MAFNFNWVNYDPDAQPVQAPLMPVRELTDNKPSALQPVTRSQHNEEGMLMDNLNLEDLISHEPYNYAYMAGALLALIEMIEIELNVARKCKCRPRMKEIRKFIDRAKTLDATQKAAQAAERKNDNV